MKKLILCACSLLLLTGCVGESNRGTSIEDCDSYDICSYFLESVKEDDSVFYSSLTELLLQTDDDIEVSYKKTPGDDMITFTYETDSAISNQFLDELVNTIEEIDTVVEAYHSINHKLYHLNFNNGISFSVYLDDSSSMNYMSAKLDTIMWTKTSSKVEDDIIQFIEKSCDTVKLLLDYGKMNSIEWYGSSQSYITVGIVDGEVIITRYGTAKSENIDKKISELLLDYTFTFKESE
jgi:hypothetical protein